jgi:hypothetical protein
LKPYINGLKLVFYMAIFINVLMKTQYLLALLSSAVIVCCAASAAAQQRPREACRADVKEFCGDVEPGHGQIIDCLEEHYKDLSDGCYNALKKMQDRKESRRNGNDGPPPPPPRGDNDGPPPPPPGDDPNMDDTMAPPPRGDVQNNDGPPPLPPGVAPQLRE